MTKAGKAAIAIVIVIVLIAVYYFIFIPSDEEKLEAAPEFFYYDSAFYSHDGFLIPALCEDMKFF